jgi:hypothetical protein
MAQMKPTVHKKHQRVIRTSGGGQVNKPSAPFGKATRLVTGKKNFSTLKRTK